MLKMSKERALLRKVCVFLDSHVENDCGIISDIRNLLSQPNEEKLSMQQRLEEYKKGYARAEQHLKRKPLSDEEINAINLPEKQCTLRELVRLIEKAHGIGVDNE
jgi:hypothetical protein